MTPLQWGVMFQESPYWPRKLPGSHRACENECLPSLDLTAAHMERLYTEVMGQQHTDFLVPTSSFLLGMATLGNLSGGFFEYNSSSTTEEADRRAMRSDFSMVGQDIRGAINQVKKGNAAQLELPLCPA